MLGWSGLCVGDDSQSLLLYVLERSQEMNPAHLSPSHPSYHHFGSVIKHYLLRTVEIKLASSVCCWLPGNEMKSETRRRGRNGCT